MKKILPVILILTILMSLLTGCTTKTVDSKAIAIVLGAHQNFPEINLNAQDIYNNILDTSYSYGSVSIVVADGDPYLFADYKFTPPDKNIDNSKRKQIAKENTEQIILDAHNAIAKTPEFDTLKALIMGANSLHSKHAAVYNILMYDSGFSTTGLLNFAKENLINVEPGDIVSRLKELHSIPDLSGINILWTGCGEVSGSQTKLTENYKYKLKAIWTAIIEAGGGTLTMYDNPLSSMSSPKDLPYCTVIPVVQESLDLTGADLSNPVKFDENSSVKFISDSAMFIDPDAAYKELEPVAQYLKSNPDIDILVIGTTATSGSEEYKKNLSSKRADTCKKALIDLGADSNNIQTIGIGSISCSLHSNDLNSNGSLNETIAPLNRAVYIVNAASTTANEILSLTNKGRE